MIGGVKTHVLSDAEATHRFCESGTGRKESVLSEFWDDSRLVRAAGGQIMHSLGLMKNIPVMIHERNLPVDLIEKNIHAPTKITR